MINLPRVNMEADSWTAVDDVPNIATSRNPQRCSRVKYCSDVCYREPLPPGEASGPSSLDAWPNAATA